MYIISARTVFVCVCVCVCLSQVRSREQMVVSLCSLQQCKGLPLASCKNCMMSLLPKRKVVNGKFIMAQWKGHYGAIYNFCWMRKDTRTKKSISKAISKIKGSRDGERIGWQWSHRLAFPQASISSPQSNGALCCTNRMMSLLPKRKVVNGKVTMAQRSHAHALEQYIT